MVDSSSSSEKTDGRTSLLIEKMRKRAALLLRTEHQTDAGAAGCYFGGKPTLPANIDWPIYTYPDPKIEIPMHFICQINFAEVPLSDEFPEHPKQGTLFFFAEPMIAPAHYHGSLPAINFGSTQVIFVAEDVTNCPPREGPKLVDLSLKGESGLPLEDEISSSYAQMRDDYGVTSTTGLHRWPIEFAPADTFYKDGFLRGRDDDFDFELLADLEAFKVIDDLIMQNTGHYFRETPSKGLAGFDGGAAYGQVPHFLFGAANLSNFPSAEVYESAGVPVLTKDHVTLLQLFGHDEAIGFVTDENNYSLSFWILKEDLAAGRFDRVQSWTEFV